MGCESSNNTKGTNNSYTLKPGPKLIMKNESTINKAEEQKFNSQIEQFLKDFDGPCEQTKKTNNDK